MPKLFWSEVQFCLYTNWKLFLYLSGTCFCRVQRNPKVLQCKGTGSFPEVFALLFHGVSTPVKLNAGAVNAKNKFALVISKSS